MKKAKPSSPPRSKGIFRGPFVSNCNLELLRPTHLSPPGPQTRLESEDVKVGRYQSSPLTYMGDQRKGVRDPPPQSSSHQDHLERSLDEPFPMALDMPLPKDVSSAIEFLARNRVESLVTFWAPQIHALKDLVENRR